MRNGIRSSALIVVALAAIAMVGCAGGSHDNPAGRSDGVALASPPSVPATPVVDRVSGLSLPIEAYMMTAQQHRTLDAAVTKLVNRCLNRFGFTRYVEDSAASAPPLMTRRYGVTDPVIAAQYGYHPAPSEGVGAVAKPSGGAAAFSDAQRLVLYGPMDAKGQPATGTQAYNGQSVPAGGCYGEANRTVKGDAFEQSDPAGLVAQIAAASAKQSESDARIVALFKKWSTCMAGKGFTYATPYEPLDGGSLKQSVTAATPSQNEIRTAVADVACKQANNVVGTWFAVESAYQNVMIQKNQESLTRIHAAIEDMMRASAAV